MTIPPFQHDWERRLHEELRKLPEHEAPASLVPSVMQAIDRRSSAAWYRRPATTWPLALRATLIVGGLCLVGLLVVAGSQWLAGTDGPNLLARFASTFGILFRSAEAVLDAVHTIIRQHSGPLLFTIAAVAATTYFALLGIGGALWRVAAQRHPVSG